MQWDRNLRQLLSFQITSNVWGSFKVWSTTSYTKAKNSRLKDHPRFRKLSLNWIWKMIQWSRHFRSKITLATLWPFRKTFHTWTPFKTCISMTIAYKHGCLAKLSIYCTHRLPAQAVISRKLIGSQILFNKESLEKLFTLQMMVKSAVSFPLGCLMRNWESKKNQSLSCFSLTLPDWSNIMLERAKNEFI